MRTHLTVECKKIREKTVDVKKLFPSLKVDYFEGIEEKVKLATKEVQETFKNQGEPYFGKQPKDYDPA